MRVTRLILKNWGPHKDLDLDMDSAVFGLLGPNASGKSNIMSAIAFAFTGLLDLNQDTYVRSVEGEDISNGSVDLYFVKGGIKGQIFRQVGKSPARKLWWDGAKKPLTKAGDIEPLMAQILDCDKQAIDQAVFLSQGHLADFLLGTPTEREESFARMCLVDRLALVADVAAQESLRLQKTVTDLTSQRDEAMLSKEQAEAALRTVESELELHPDRSRELEWLSEHIVATEQLHGQQAQYQAQLAVVQTTQERAAALTAPAWLAAGTEAETGTSLQEAIAKARVAESEAQTLQRSQAMARQSRSREAELRKTTLETMGLAPRMYEVQQALDAVLKQIIDAQAYQAWIAQEAQWQARWKANQDSQAKGAEEILKLGTVEEIQAKATAVQEGLAALAGRKFQLQLATEAEGHASGCCPLCQGTDLSRILKGPELAAAKAELAREEADLKAIQTTIANELGTLNRYLARMEELKAQEAQLRTERQAPWDASKPQIAADQLPALEIERRKLDEERAAIHTRLQALPGQQNELNTLSETNAQQPTEEEFAQRIAACQAQAQDLQQNLDKQAELSAYVQRKAEHRQHVEAAQAKLTDLQDSIDKLLAVAKARWNMKPVGLLLEVEATVSTLREALQQLQEKQAARERVQGMIRANTDALRRAENRVAEIEERARRNAATLTVIGQLDELKDAFSRQGIPRHYLAKVFETLAAMTQERLVEWETDFQVERDPEQLFNFQFYRTDSPNTLLDQSQLSGGQRTRLALSFVQSVQQLLYPGLDFLCVDEPSNHLDAEGVEGLVRLFQSISAQNEDGEAQVIVIDHNPLLQRAFSKSVTLSRLAQ